MDELGKKETLYDIDILVRMYYRIILLCKFTIIPNSTICSKSRLYNFRISKMPNLVFVKFNPLHEITRNAKPAVSWFQPGSHPKEALSYAGGTMTGIGHISKAAMTSSVVDRT